MPDINNLRDFARQELKKYNLPEREDLYDPETNRNIPQVTTGVLPYYRAAQVAPLKAKSRSTGGYTAEGTPQRGGTKHSAKHMGLSEYKALKSHGADAVLSDLKLIHSARNNEFWNKVKAGQTPSVPDTPEVYKKFRDMIRASGVNLREDEEGDHIYAMTDQDAKRITGQRKIQKPATYDQKGRAIKGGLMDGELASGKFGYIDLPEPMLNPIMENPVRKILGMNQQEFDQTIRGETDQSLQEKLKNIDVDAEMEKAKKEMGSKSQDRRDRAYTKYQYLNAMKENNTRPEDFMMSRVPVLPSEWRPITEMDGKSHIVTDPNRMYRDLMFKVQDYKDAQEYPELVPEAREELYNSFRSAIGTAQPKSPRLKQENVRGALMQFLGKGSPKACYDDNTEILTEDGWMWFKDYQGQSKVATVHPTTHNVEYHNPSEIIHYPYKGNMVRIQMRSKADLLVTPDHRNWVKHVKSDNWRFFTAEDLMQTGNRMWMLRTGQGFKGHKNIPTWVNCTPEEFAEFVGLWIAEGCICHKTSIQLTQTPSQNNQYICDRIEELLEKMGLGYRRYHYYHSDYDYKGHWADHRKTWTMADRRLADWLDNNVGSGCGQKGLSHSIKFWHEDLLKALLKGYLMGDGEKNKQTSRNSVFTYTHEFHDWKTFSTTSYELAEDLQQIGIHIGVPMTIQEPGYRKNWSLEDREKFKPAYRVSLPVGCYAAGNGKEQIAYYEPYNGYVHCVTVPNGLVIVRRNGRTCVSGNSMVQRRNIGSDIDIYGLGVLTPESKMNMDEIGIPEEQAWKVYEPFTIRSLVKSGISPRKATEEVESRTTRAKNALRKEVESRPTLINRAPTLHKFGLQAFKGRMVPGSAIRMNPYVMGGFNADADGDILSLTTPATEKAVQEAWDKMLPSKNLLDPKGDPVYTPDNEMIQGLYLMTKSPEDNRKPVRTTQENASQAAKKAYNQMGVDVDSPVIGADPGKNKQKENTK